MKWNLLFMWKCRSSIEMKHYPEWSLIPQCWFVACLSARFLVIGSRFRSSTLSTCRFDCDFCPGCFLSSRAEETGSATVVHQQQPCGSSELFSLAGRAVPLLVRTATGATAECPIIAFNVLFHRCRFATGLWRGRSCYRGLHHCLICHRSLEKSFVIICVSVPLLLHDRWIDRSHSVPFAVHEKLA